MKPDRWTEDKWRRFTEAGQWPDATILSYLDDAVERTPEKPALVDKRGRYTYAELAETVENLAAGLLDLGIEPEEAIAHQIPNRNEGVILHLAAVRAGIVVNPIVEIYRESEVSYMFEKLGTTAYVAPEEHRGHDYRQMATDLYDDAPDLEFVIVLDPEEAPTADHVWSFEDVLERGREADVSPGDPVPPNEVALIQFTSGTTGRPKAAMHTENTLLAAQLGQIDRLGLTSDEVILTPSPIGHLTGIQHGYRTAIMVGGTAVLQERWDGETALEWIESESCTYMAGATPFVRDLTEHPARDEYDTASLSLIMTAGAPCPREVVRAAHEGFENLTVCRGWGQTENTLPTVNAPDAPEEKLQTTDGKPYGGMEARIRQPGALEDAMPGQEGELQVRGPFLFLGYYEDEERTENSFTDDGWFKTGDKAVIDDEGYVTIKGRIKDIIIRGGENIPVREIEEYLHENDEVDDAVIVAMPDERLQERACAYVVPRDEDDPITFDEMIAFLETKGIATQKLPERLEIVSELPTTASGKVQRYKLREDVADKLDMEPVTR
ncbi:MAG: AMP-binding protein [Halanaeroarchaeum sp.]